MKSKMILTIGLLAVVFGIATTGIAIKSVQAGASVTATPEKDSSGSSSSTGLRRGGDKVIAGLHNIGLAMLRFQNLSIFYCEPSCGACVITLLLTLTPKAMLSPIGHYNHLEHCENVV